MPKYYYTVKEDVCDETYKINAKKSLFEDGYYPLEMVLVVTAKDETESEKIRIAATDIRMWTLDHVDEF